MSPTRIDLELSEVERAILAALTLRQQSAFAFWQRVLARRAIVIPASKIPRIEPKGLPNTGHYKVRLENKKLSPQAIAEGKAYQKFAKELEAKAHSSRRF